MPTVDQIREAHEEATQADDTAGERREKRDDLIRLALADGMRVEEIVAATGLHRQRIYQIRDRRR